MAPDTNVFADYLVYSALDLGGYDMATLKKRNVTPHEIKAYLDKKTRDGSMRIVDTVYEEALRVIRRIVNTYVKARKIPASVGARIIRTALEHAAGVPAGLRCPDNASVRGAVVATYGRAWADPGSLALRERWAHVKHGRVDRWSRGPPCGADVDILSTAAALARKRRVCLLTGDHDFIVFRREIRDGLGAEVVDPWHPDRWPA